MKKVNIKFIVAYDGADYFGWQRQVSKRTIQGEIEKNLSKLLKENIEIHGSGRTDSGVHSYGQTVHFCCNLIMPLENLMMVLNRKLPKDIYIKSMEIVPDEFHARYNSLGKKYLYRIDNSKEGNPFLSRYSYNYSYDLNISKMKEACKYFIGRHDFAGFMASGSSVKTTVREIYHIKITESKETKQIEIEFYGNGFLYNMVRIIVGSLLDVGRGKISPDEITDIIKSKDRNRAKITAPACGLYLKEVVYENK